MSPEAFEKWKAEQRRLWEASLLVPTPVKAAAAPTNKPAITPAPVAPNVGSQAPMRRAIDIARSRLAQHRGIPQHYVMMNLPPPTDYPLRDYQREAMADEEQLRTFQEIARQGWQMFREGLRLAREHCGAAPTIDQIAAKARSVPHCRCTRDGLHDPGICPASTTGVHCTRCGDDLPADHPFPDAIREAHREAERGPPPSMLPDPGGRR